MKSPLYMKWTKFENGERFPFIIDRSTGIPLFYPTVYTIAMPRSVGKASATLAMSLRAIIHLYTWALSEGINMEERFNEGNFFSTDEIDSLCRAAAKPYNYLTDEIKKFKAPSHTKPRKPTNNIESFRKRNQSDTKWVKKQTKTIRLIYIRLYLDWLSHDRTKKISKKSDSYEEIKSSRIEMIEAIKARTSSKYSPNIQYAKEGLSHDEENRLKEVIKPDSPENPWKNLYVKIRNQLFVLMMLSFGTRRSDLTQLRIKNMPGGTILFGRNPDDPDDPRIQEGNTKTNPRILPVDDDLSDLIDNYIIEVRSKIPNADKHDFLFVSVQNGAPMSHSSVTKMFSDLRNHFPDLPDDLTSHTMRYTWNDRFSDRADKAKLSKSEEKDLRTYQMGWSKRSEMASYYAKRHTRKKATKYSLEIQKSVMKKDEDVDDVQF